LRIDCEADAFPYDPPRDVDLGESSWESVQRARQETEAQLRKLARPGSQGDLSKVIFVDPARWGR
jgi:hypothetical protein